MKPLDGRVALVVGGSRGIGLGAARSLGRDGALVTICSLREHLEDGVAALSAAGNADTDRCTRININAARNKGKKKKKKESVFIGLP